MVLHRNFVIDVTAVVFFICCTGQGVEENANTGKPHFVLDSDKTFLTFDADEQHFVATYTCKFTGAEPLNVSWHYNGLHVSDVDPKFEILHKTEKLVTVSRLVIKGFTNEFDLEFTCLAVNSHGYGYHDFWLEAAPSVTIEEKTNELLKPGESITANCTSFPNSLLSWQLPGFASRRNETSVSVVTGDVSTVSTITLTLTDEDNGAEFKCCAISSNPMKRAKPSCSSFTVNATQPMAVDYSSNCSQSPESDLNNCSLTCTVRSNPSVVDKVITSWHFCPDPPPDLDYRCTDLADGLTEALSDEVSVVTTHRILSSEISLGNYTCKAVVEDHEMVEHSFIINGEQASSSFVHITRLNTSDDSYAGLQCTFVANPIASAYWIVNGVGETSGYIIISEDSGPYDIDTHSGIYEVSTLTLRISPFTESELAWYSCIIENSMAIIKSDPVLLEKLPEYYDFELQVTPKNITDQTQVTALCSIKSDVTPVNIRWRLLTEFENLYEVVSALESVDNVHNSRVQFNTDWRNDIVRIKCAVTFASAPSVPISEEHQISINYVPQVFEFKNCNAEDFDSGHGGCRLSFTSQHDGRHVFKGQRWAYYGVNQSHALILTGESMSRPAPHRIQTTLFLEDFSAGFYQCSATYMNVDSEQMITVNHTFQIEPHFSGVPLSGACNLSRQCLTLNSQCTSGKCSCETGSTPWAETACLKMVRLEEACVTNEQCNYATKNSVCIGGEPSCRCLENYVNISLPTPRCITNVSVGGSCTVDDECFLMTKYSACINLTCQCVDTYKFDSLKQECVLYANASLQNSDTVSTGSVVGILLLVGIVVAVGAAVIITSVKKYKKKQRKLKMQQARDVDLQHVGPGAIGHDRLNTNNDTNYWYNPHQPARLNLSTSSRAS